MGPSFESPFFHWFLEASLACDVTGFFLSAFILLQKWKSFLARSSWVAFQCCHGTLGRARTTKAEAMKINNYSQIDAFEIFESFSIFLLHNHNIIRIQMQ